MPYILYKEQEQAALDFCFVEKIDAPAIRYTSSLAAAMRTNLVKAIYYSFRYDLTWIDVDIVSASDR